MKTALITGIGGQDGSHLADLLLNMGYEVHGIIRRSSNFNTQRVEHIFNDITMHYGDLTDGLNIYNLVSMIKPDEIYNLGAQSHVMVSFSIPIYTLDTIVKGTAHLLEAIRHINPKIKFYQASSSEMYGKVQEIPQTETTPFHPRSPYACAKVCAHYLTQNYRESFGLHASAGILFNHEGERRGDTFVTKKIVNYITRYYKDIQSGMTVPKLLLGNLDAKRDWGYAPDYVNGMWRIVQQENPDDYVLATGETHSVREFCEEAFSYFKFDYKDFVETDPKYIRPAEVDLLLGDASKAKRILGWEPTIKFQELVEIMIEENLNKEI